MLVGIADAYFQSSLELCQLLDVFHQCTTTCEHDACYELVFCLRFLDFVVDEFENLLQTGLDDMSQVLERDFFRLASADARDGHHFVVAVFAGQGRTEFHLHLFGVMPDDGTACADVLGDDVAAKGNHGGVLDLLVFEDGDIGSAAADVDENHAGVLFLFVEDGLCRGDRLKDHVIHLQTSTLDAFHDVFGRRGLTDNDMEVGFDFVAQHTHGIGGQLSVDVGVLPDDVYDFLTRSHVDFKCVVAQAFQFGLGDFGLVVVAHQHAAVLQTLDVLTSDADADAVDFHARLV